MRKPSGDVIRADSETVVGEDAWGIPIVECPEIKIGRKGECEWAKCVECGNQVLNDVFGTYYHKLSCSRSNGIGYNEERENTTLPHLITCSCNTCEPPTEKKGKK